MHKDSIPSISGEDPFCSDKQIFGGKTVDYSREQSIVFHDGSWNIPELNRMFEGYILNRGGGRYGICQKCLKVVRVNKPIIGGVHFCNED